MYNTKITAHSGAENTPQNSVEYIEKALITGADGLEADMQLNGDRLVLSHNRPESADEGISIKELFSRLAGTGKYINCDCKQKGIAKKILTSALESGLELSQLIFTGSVAEYEIPELKGAFVYRNSEELGISGLFERPFDYSLIERAAELCASSGSGINLNYRNADQKTIEIMKSRGIKTTVWTVDDEEAMKTMLEYGVDVITTNRPLTALGFRNGTK